MYDIKNIYFVAYLIYSNFNFFFFRILTKTTQPAHVIAVLIMSFVVYILWPNIFGVPVIIEERNVFSMLMYLGTFAAHFGAQIWMTFVSGEFSLNLKAFFM